MLCSFQYFKLTETKMDSELTTFEIELEKCSEITTTYKRLDCEKPIKKAMTLYSYQTNAQKFDLGPITYYWLGVGSEGNEFEITQTGMLKKSMSLGLQSHGAAMKFL